LIRIKLSGLNSSVPTWPANGFGVDLSDIVNVEARSTKVRESGVPGHEQQDNARTIERFAKLCQRAALNELPGQPRHVIKATYFCGLPK
jgi:hypothetical protein